MANRNYDAVMMTETSLDSDINDTELDFQNYEIFRKDKNPDLIGNIVMVEF